MSTPSHRRGCAIPDLAESRHGKGGTLSVRLQALGSRGGRAAFDTCAAVTRAHKARRFPGSSEADRPARAAWSALRLLVDVVIFVLAKLLVGKFWFGADDGAQAIDADVGFAGSERGAGAGADRAKARYGVIDNRSEIPQH